MRAVEHQYNTAAQVEGYLDEALRIVANVAPPTELAGICLGKAIDLLAAKHVQLEQVAPVLDPMRIPVGR